MGIRYYAYPIAADDVDAARADPWAFLSEDPLADAWGLHRDDEPEPPKPTMLYLDKAWSELQMLLEPKRGHAPRPAFRLVQGNVTFVGLGWEAYTQVLTPAEVAGIATDLATVTRADIAAMSVGDRWRLGDDDYVALYLAAAQQFTADMAKLGVGLVTMIG